MYGTDALNVMQAEPIRRNIMQGGLPKRDLASIRAEYEQLKKEVETQILKLEQTNNNNIRQAGIQVSDKQVFETMIAFSNNEEYYELPKRHNNVMATGIKQASVRKPASDIEVLQTLLEFGGLS